MGQNLKIIRDPLASGPYRHKKWVIARVDEQGNYNKGVGIGDFVAWYYKDHAAAERDLARIIAEDGGASVAWVAALEVK
jgi:hypothetical protein